MANVPITARTGNRLRAAFFPNRTSSAWIAMANAVHSAMTIMTVPISLDCSFSLRSDTNSVCRMPLTSMK